MSKTGSVSDQNGWTVHKFGGTSMGSAERQKTVASIMGAQPGRKKAIVVSAMSGTTDALIAITDLARARDAGYEQKLEQVLEKHRSTLQELLPSEKSRAPFLETLNADRETLREILRGVWLARSLSDRIQELISGYGELWSSQLLCAYLQSQGQPCNWLDAREILVVEPGTDSVTVNWELSQSRMDTWAAKNTSDWVVITGFVASTPEGIPTTLQRNGSDYSAAIFGALLNAWAITIWTDVDGVLSADPRRVPEAVVLSDISYEEATELAYFGAKVVHPKTMGPAIQKKIPIWIRNTFNSSHPGTKIHERSSTDAPVQGFSTVDDVALINVEGTGMIGVPGIAQRLFGALKDAGTSVILISQGSSEHSICFAVPSKRSASAKATVEQAFFAELHQGRIQKVEVIDDCSILAAVGDQMAQNIGTAGRFLSALGRAGVNVRAIAQGSSERNISVVVSRDEATRALRAAHASFFLSNHTISIGVIGTGWIGNTLLEQIRDSAERLKREYKLDLRIRGIADSKQMFLENLQIDLGTWKDRLEKKTQSDPATPLDLSSFAAHIQAPHLPHAVIIDCTASPAVASRYAEWLKRGIHVITPNKKACSGPFTEYQDIRNAARQAQRHFLYETTVGAGLPVIKTLQDLIQTGDRVDEVEGVLSGTLSYIFNSLTPDRKFSEVVRDARDRGFTEPDPRDDLSGMDVARKVVILAREMGLSLELSDVKVEGLVPPELQKSGIDDFMERLPSHDEKMLSLIQGAHARGEVLRYVGRVTREGEASVKLQAYALDHPFARVKATDNILAYRTQRYSAQPLIVQGPGAGPEVTAGGVFADLLRLSSYLGASL